MTPSPRSRRPSPIAAASLARLALLGTVACQPSPEPGPQPLAAARPDSVRLTAAAYLAEVDAVTRRRGRIKGWTDSQPLAERVVQGVDTVLRYGPGAKIVPIDDLEKLRDDDFYAWQRVAFIYIERAYPKLLIPTPPPPTSGPFEVIMHRTTASDSLGWQMKIRHPVTGFVSDTQPVVREPHRSAARADVPGSARWIFVPNDEVLWLACGMGCCTGGRAQSSQ